MRNFTLRINLALEAQKKLFILFLALIVSVGTIFASTKIGDLYYNLNATSQTAEVTYQSYNSSSNYSDLVTAKIPSSIEYNSVIYNVTSIGDYAFRYCKNMTSVTIPNSVIRIGNYAFSTCSCLTSVEIPNSVTSIGNAAFASCGVLTSITLPNSITSIGAMVFFSCGLTSIEIPNSVTIIGDKAFRYCSNLSSITIGNSVTSIGNDVFSECPKLTSVTLNSNAIASKTYTSSANLKNIFGEQITEYILGDDIISIGNYAFYDCLGLTSVTIGNSLTSIGEDAFCKCTGLTSITIPNSAISIENNAFYQCTSLTSAVIGNSVTSIGDYAFYKCTSLTSIEFPNSVKSIGKSAFGSCFKLTSVTIPNSVTSIGNYAFDSCSRLTSIIVAEGNTIYDSRNNCNAIIETATNTLIRGCNSTTIPNSVTSIGHDAFYKCFGLTSVEIPNSVTSIGEEAFNYCNDLTSVVWKAKNCSLPSKTSSCPFYGVRTQITSFIFGNEVENIPDYLCFEMNKLTSIEIPNSVTSIGTQAFSNCTGLTNVHISDFAAWCRIAFSSLSSNPLYYAGHLYMNSTEINDIVIPDIITNIGGYAFSGYTGLTSITIPNSVTSIGELAFYGCSGLTSVTIPNSVKSIGGAAFQNCSGLKSIELSRKAPPTLGESVFYNCSNSLIYVPCGTLDTYKQYWSDYADRICYRQYTVTGEANLKEAGYFTIPTATPCGDGVISANSNYGYHFVQWSDGDISNPRAFQLTQDTTFTAEFAKNIYTITAASDNAEYGSVTGGKTAEYLDEIMLTATAQNGHHFEYWLSGKTKYNDNPLTVIAQEDATYTAYFAWNVYTLTINANLSQGYVTAPTQAEFMQEVKMTATPLYGYEFVQWNDGVKDNPRMIRLTQDTTFTAEFSIAQYTISTAVNDEARGTVTEDQKAEHLTSVELTATANYGYHFEYWESDGKQYTSNPLTVTVTDNALYTAYFFPNTYNINVYSGNSSMGSVSAPQHAEYLDLVTLTANPKEGYHFSQWNDGNIDNPRTIVLVQDTTFTAEFAYDRTGTCGKDFALVWSYDPMKKTLTISNAGAFTENMNYGVEAPKEMQELVIDDGVTSIGAGAFKGCSSLQRVTIGNSVTSIGNSAFAGCSNLKSVTLNSNALVSNAYTSSFNLKSIFGEQVTEYIIGEDIISIGNYAFCDCSNLTSVSIGNGVTSIGSSAFYGCKGLTSVHISNLAAWCHTTFSSNVSNPLYYAHHLYLNNTEITELTIPNSVTSIGNYAFNGCTNITSATIPNSVASIGDDAFNGCTGLTSVTVGNNVTSIGNTAFGGCSGLKSITLPHSVTSIGHGAFSDCSGLTSFDIPDGVIGLGQYIFSGCTSLQTISIPKSVNTIIPQYQGYDISPFTGINIDSQSGLPMEGALTAFIVDPENPIYTAKDGVLYNKNMTKLIQFPCAKKDAYTIPESVIYIEDYAFYGNQILTELNLPRNVRVIEDGAFAYMVNLKTLHLSEELVKIGVAGFLGCCDIEALTFGSKLKSIGNQAFTLNINKCKGITCFANQVPTLETEYVGAITVGKSTGYIWENWEEVPPSALTVYVPQASIGDYIMDENWGQFTILPITAQQTNVEDLIVVPSTNTVDCSWPAVSGAATYELVIKDKSGNLICTLIFNAQGQLTQIAFNAPARDNAPEQTQSAGFHFTVTGLNSGTGYDLSLTAKNESGQEIDKKNVSFHTNTTQGIEDIHVDAAKAVKVLHNGQIYILRGDHIFDAQGKMIK